MSTLPMIAGIEITTDSEGRFSLNCLHKASGLGDSKKPSEWLRTKQAEELINELSGNSRLGQDVIKSVKGGVSPGTFSHELLAISYAGWISPSFQLQVNQVFIDYKTGKLSQPKNKVNRQATVDSVIQDQRRAKCIMKTTMDIGKILGTEPAMCKAIAVEQVSRQIGIDYSNLLTHNSVEEQPITPTELGKLSGVSAVKMNLLLKDQGFQYRDENGEWRPTEKGEKYCTCNPYKSKHSHHTGYRTLWFPSVIKMLDKAA